jgi:hypothetical protein
MLGHLPVVIVGVVVEVIHLEAVAVILRHPMGALVPGHSSAVGKPTAKRRAQF